MVVSIQLGTGPHFASSAADTNLAGGIIQVDRIERFVLDQKVTLVDNDTAAGDFYVINIDINTSDVTLSATRGGAAASLIAYTTAANAKFYTDDADAVSYQSIRGALLSLANGGDANVHGVSKLLYPFLQAVNVDGSTITSN